MLRVVAYFPRCSSWSPGAQIFSHCVKAGSFLIIGGCKSLGCGGQTTSDSRRTEGSLLYDTIDPLNLCREGCLITPRVTRWCKSAGCYVLACVVQDSDGTRHRGRVPCDSAGHLSPLTIWSTLTDQDSPPLLVTVKYRKGNERHSKTRGRSRLAPPPSTHLSGLLTHSSPLKSATASSRPARRMRTSDRNTRPAAKAMPRPRTSQVSPTKIIAMAARTGTRSVNA